MRNRHTLRPLASIGAQLDEKGKLTPLIMCYNRLRQMQNKQVMRLRQAGFRQYSRRKCIVSDGVVQLTVERGILNELRRQQRQAGEDYRWTN
jgi:hypothetical protein